MLKQQLNPGPGQHGGFDPGDRVVAVTTQAGLGQAGSGQAGSGQAGSGQAGSGQAGSGQAGFSNGDTGTVTGPGEGGLLV